MANIEKHSPGTFCWIELATSDQEAAKKFYGNLFGWAANDSPMGPDQYYTMFTLEGRNAAAAYTLMEDEAKMGVPPHWNIYVTVDNADETANKAKELGATILAGPFDVFEFGRMAVMQDPTGAVISIWQAKSHIGTAINGIDGTMCWADLNTRDIAKATEFYSALFGWKIEAGENDPSGYLHIKNGEEFIGGVPPSQHMNPNAPPHWIAYFLTSDCDATANKAKDTGATLYLPPMTMEGVGRMSVMADPQGAVFSIFQPLPHEKH